MDTTRSRSTSGCSPMSAGTTQGNPRPASHRVTATAACTPANASGLVAIRTSSPADGSAKIALLCRRSSLASSTGTWMRRPIATKMACTISSSGWSPTIGASRSFRRGTVQHRPGGLVQLLHSGLLPVWAQGVEDLEKSKPDAVGGKLGGHRHQLLADRARLVDVPGLRMANCLDTQREGPGSGEPVTAADLHRLLRRPRGLLTHPEPVVAAAFLVPKMTPAVHAHPLGFGSAAELVVGGPDLPQDTLGFLALAGHGQRQRMLGEDEGPCSGCCVPGHRCGAAGVGQRPAGVLLVDLLLPTAGQHPRGQGHVV